MVALPAAVLPQQAHAEDAGLLAEPDMQLVAFQAAGHDPVLALKSPRLVA